MTVDSTWLKYQSRGSCCVVASASFHHPASEGGDTDSKIHPAWVLFGPCQCTNPICSMYGIVAYIWVIFRANVGTYSIHGAFGNDIKWLVKQNRSPTTPWHEVWQVVSNVVSILGWSSMWRLVIPILTYLLIIWVCLKIGYIPNYSHLIGIMIINHWV